MFRKNNNKRKLEINFNIYNQTLFILKFSACRITNKNIYLNEANSNKSSKWLQMSKFKLK